MGNLKNGYGQCYCQGHFQDQGQYEILKWGQGLYEPKNVKF